MPITPPPTFNEAQLADIARRAEQGDQSAISQLKRLGDYVDVIAKGPPTVFDTGSLPPLTGSNAPPPIGPGTGAQFTSPSILPPPTSSGAPTSSAPTPPPEEGEGGGGIGGWWDKNKGNVLKVGVGMGLSGLAQALGGGKSGARALEGFNAGFLPQLKAEQQQMLARRQAAWETTYEDMKNLPPEIYAEEKFAPLTQAAQALEKDMADGQIDNEKNYTNFLRLQREFQGDVAEFMQGVQLQREADAARNKFEMSNQLIDERLKQLTDALNVPGLSPQDTQRIQAQINGILAEGEQIRLESERLNAQVQHWQAQRTADERSMNQRDRALAQTDRSLNMREQERGTEQADIDKLGSARALVSEVESLVSNAASQASQVQMGRANPPEGGLPGYNTDTQMFDQRDVMAQTLANPRIRDEIMRIVGAEELGPGRVRWNGQDYDVSNPQVAREMLLAMYAQVTASARTRSY